MDLRNFKESTRPAANKAGFFHRELTRIKYWLLPPTNDKRKERFAQYKDLAIFTGAIVAVAIFEEKISKLFEIDTADLSRGLWLNATFIIFIFDPIIILCKQFSSHTPL